MKPIAFLVAATLSLTSFATAQQFDVTDGEVPFVEFGQPEGEAGEGGEDFDDFELDGGDGTGLTLSEGAEDGDIQLNLGTGSPGVFTTFPGVTGPVTSVSQPETEQGTTMSLRALDKMLGQPMDIELSIGQTVVFGRIAIRAVECRFPTADPGGDAFALIEILDLDGRDLFTGWMIASSPALNALEHARYDVWALGCSA
ncbi:DUF2155 domain-containing protein [Gymnodinialimonas ceratoperidinii]|nr:DUF2155 domain-containing protein [Gymnodinialimonas ceratoperidinii]